MIVVMCYCFFVSLWFVLWLVFLLLCWVLFVGFFLCFCFLRGIILLEKTVLCTVLCIFETGSTLVIATAFIPTIIPELVK